MLTTEPVEVDIVQNIDIVYEDRLIGVEEVLGMLQSPTRLEQLLSLVAESHQRSIVLLGYIVENLLGEMVHVDHKPGVAKIHQTPDVAIEQRSTSYWHQRLGHSVCEGFQSGADSGSKYHGLLHGEIDILIIGLGGFA